MEKSSRTWAENVSEVKKELAAKLERGEISQADYQDIVDSLDPELPATKGK